MARAIDNKHFFPTRPMSRSRPGAKKSVATRARRTNTSYGTVGAIGVKAYT